MLGYVKRMIFGGPREDVLMLDEKLSEMFSAPTRQEVPLGPGETWSWSGFGFPPAPGHRWETDTELRARILATRR